MTNNEVFGFEYDYLTTHVPFGGDYPVFMFYNCTFYEDLGDDFAAGDHFDEIEIDTVAGIIRAKNPNQPPKERRYRAILMN